MVPLAFGFRSALPTPRFCGAERWKARCIPSASSDRPSSRRWQLASASFLWSLSLLLLAMLTCSTAQDGIQSDVSSPFTPLVLGVLTSGKILPPQTAVYTVPVSQCLQHGSILIELISPALSPADVTPSGMPPNSSAPAPSSSSSMSPNQTLTALPKLQLPLLLLNAQGGTPQTHIIRMFSYIHNPNTMELDFPDYQTQQAVQYRRIQIPSNASATLSWTLGVFADFYLGAYPMQFWLRASCSAALACPANCGGPARGRCNATSGLCVCVGQWGGATCTIVMDDLAAANDTAQVLGPGQWLYYQFHVPAPSANVLLQVARTSGDPLVLMKPAADGYLVQSIPTLFDFDQHSDSDGYQNSLPLQFIYWPAASPGVAYIAIYNNPEDRASLCNLTLDLYTQPILHTPSTSLPPLCPLNCSYPNGNCVANASAPLSAPSCQCSDGYSGRFCEGRVYGAALDVPLVGVLFPLNSAFFHLKQTCASNTSVQILYSGGHLFVLVAGNASSVAALPMGAMELPILSTNTFQDSTFQLSTASPSTPLYVGIYNSDRYLTQNSSIRITFSCSSSSDGGPSFATSPYLVTVVSVVGALVLAVLALFVRRLCCCSAVSATSGGRETLGVPLADLTVVSVEALHPPRRVGVAKEIIASFPLVSFQPHVFTALHESQCAVCLAEYEEGEVVKKLPHCHHMFHVTCIGEWLASHDTCPCCRCLLDQAPEPRLEAQAQPLLLPQPQASPSPDPEQHQHPHSQSSPQSQAQPETEHTPASACSEPEHGSSAGVPCLAPPVHARAGEGEQVAGESSRELLLGCPSGGAKMEQDRDAHTPLQG